MTPKADNTSMNRCATCKHLGEPDPLEAASDEVDPDDGETIYRSSEHRLCMRIPDAGEVVVGGGCDAQPAEGAVWEQRTSAPLLEGADVVGWRCAGYGGSVSLTAHALCAE